jgi:pyruvate/2-oxoacid:ferredoxin oxidoreductase beta subunit
MSLRPKSACDHSDVMAARPVQEYLNLENRFKMLSKARPAEAKLLFQEAQKHVNTRWPLYQQLAKNDSTSKKTQ